MEDNVQLQQQLDKEPRQQSYPRNYADTLQERVAIGNNDRLGSLVPHSHAVGRINELMPHQFLLAVAALPGEGPAPVDLE